MTRFKLTVAYDGTGFHGWQRQAGPDGEPLRTVQEALEQAVTDVVRAPTAVLGASRTDSGVHARGQVAVFDAEPRVPLERMPMAINARLPDDVQVRRAEIVADDFNPIGDCVSKGYRYRLAHDCALENPRPLFARHVTAWTAYTLDPARMHEAAQHLVGEHDFASLTRVDHGRESTVRTIHACTVHARGANRVIIDVSGNGFLYNMVRIIAGTLVEIGRGKWAPDDLPGILEAKDRQAAGPTMPGEGLCLMWVGY